MERKKKYTPQQAWPAIQKYCAYQERCHREVHDKLYEMGLNTDDVNELASRLITEGFLNEERFAKAFAGGKFRVKKWGRNKIKHELRLRKISDYCIKQAMAEIDDVHYYEQLEKLVYRRFEELKKEKNPLVRNNKTGSYLIGKGYEPDLVWDVIKTLSQV